MKHYPTSRLTSTSPGNVSSISSSADTHISRSLEGESIARPLGVTILAALAVFAAVVLIAGGIFSLLATTIPGLTPEEVQLIRALGAVMLPVGVLYFAGGVGLLQLKLWGWWLAVAVSVISAVTNAIQMAVSPAFWWEPAPALVLSLIILAYLFAVRGEFGAPS